MTLCDSLFSLFLRFQILGLVITLDPKHLVEASFFNSRFIKRSLISFELGLLLSVFFKGNVTVFHLLIFFLQGLDLLVCLAIFLHQGLALRKEAITTAVHAWGEALLGAGRWTLRASTPSACIAKVELG